MSPETIWVMLMATFFSYHADYALQIFVDECEEQI